MNEKEEDLYALLQDAHDLLDESNNTYSGTYCQWCKGGNGYDGDGLLHEEDCILVRIRKVL